MSIFLICVLVIIIIGAACFASKDLKIQKQELDRLKIDLQNKTDNFENERRKFIADCGSKTNAINLERYDVDRKYQIALSIKDEMQKNIVSTEIKIKNLKKQIEKLQNELKHSRQRSQRLAKRAKNTL